MKIKHNLELVNPATDKTFRSLPVHSWKDVKKRLKISAQTQMKWKDSTIESRIDLIQRSMEYFNYNTESIAQDITLKMGKPISQSRYEVKTMINRAEVCCELSLNALKEIPISKTDELECFIKREPLGVVLDIAAWNYPLLIAVNIVVPAVLAGNAVAIKHSSLTPLCAIAFEDAFRHANAPDGLVTSLIMDHITTEKAIQSGLIHHLSFTGSVGGGRQVQTEASRQFINVGLELGGKDPAYIREDSDLLSAVPAIMDGVFYNAGQSCCAIERIYVDKSLHDKVVKEAIEYMNNLKIGNPLDDTTDMGPLAEESGIKTIRMQIKDALDKGAKITNHPGPLPNGKQYLLPAILTNVNHDMEIMMDETFGPIVGIMGVNSDEEAIQLMNDSPYGLTASVWTNNNKKAIDIGSKIETGTFFLNRCDYLDPSLPWSGVKDSGKGCTLSHLGIQQLTRPKAYNLKLNN